MNQINTSGIPDAKLSDQLHTLIRTVKQISGDNLISVILFGGVAKGDYSSGKSNTNVLLVFDRIDLDVLDQLNVHFQKAISDFRFSPFLLTISEIEPSKRVFAVKFFDIISGHILLYGKDVLKDISVDKSDLRFIAEQELRNQLARMKFFYIQNFNLQEKLADKALKCFTTLLINANTYLYLKKGKYHNTREEILSHLSGEPGVDANLLNEFQLLRKGQLSPDAKKTRELYGGLMLQFKFIIKDLEKL